MTNIFGKRGLLFDRFGEEINYDNRTVDLVERVDTVDKVKKTFSFTKTYVSLKGRRLVRVASAIDPFDCVVKKQLDDLERKLNTTTEVITNTDRRA